MSGKTKGKKMINRIKRIFNNETRTLLNRLERPIPTLEGVKKELYEKAVTAKKQALKLERSSKSPGVRKDTSARLLKAAKKLDNIATTYKSRYNDADNLIMDLKARKISAEAELEAMKLLSSYSISGDDIQSVLARVEEQIKDTEREVDALMFMDTSGEEYA